MLLFVPDQIPDDDMLKPAAGGIFVKANLCECTWIHGSGADTLEPGRIIYGEGELSIAKDQLPVVELRTLLVFWRKLNMDHLTLPSLLLETFSEEVGVSSHLRKLPKGKKATRKQRLLAAKEGTLCSQGVYLR